MQGSLRIVLIVPFTDDTHLSAQKEKAEEFIRLNSEFKIDRIEYVEYAKRPSEDMTNMTLLDIVKRLDELIQRTKE